MVEMETTSTTNTSQILKKVRKIEIKTRGLSNQIFAGEYHSAFKGRGMSFAEVREYQYGDDIRNIDWNVTARFNKPFIKVFEEERELTVMLLIDVSRSEVFGTNRQMKAELITELAAVLSFSAIQNNDKVGVIFFSDTIEKFIVPKKGKKHILRIIRELIDFKSSQTGTDIALALKYLTNSIKKRSTTFVLSDFLDSGFEKTLRIANNKHDIIALQIADRREFELPDIGLVKLYDPEQKTFQWVDTGNNATREAYRKWRLQHQAMLSDNFIRTGVDNAILYTGEDYVKTLKSLFKKRSKF
jgi:uncharacterized protein (DUF58 family)